MNDQERLQHYKRALEKIRDYGGPDFRASQYARKVAKEALSRD